MVNYKGEKQAGHSGSHLYSQNFGRPRHADHLRSGVRDHPGQRGETPSLLKIQKISWAWWHVPVIPATQEAKAGEWPEPRRRRLRWAEIAPLHSSLGNKSETPSQKKKKKVPRASTIHPVSIFFENLKQSHHLRDHNIVFKGNDRSTESYKTRHLATSSPVLTGHLTPSTPVLTGHLATSTPVTAEYNFFSYWTYLDYNSIGCFLLTDFKVMDSDTE